MNSIKLTFVQVLVQCGNNFQEKKTPSRETRVTWSEYCTNSVEAGTEPIPVSLQPNDTVDEPIPALLLVYLAMLGKFLILLANNLALSKEILNRGDQENTVL